MQRQIDKKQARQVLEVAISLLPEKPLWVILQDADAFPVAVIDTDELDESIAMIHAMNDLGERALKWSGYGEFRYHLIFGDEGIFFSIRLNTGDDKLGMGFEKLSSVDAIINTLPEMVNVLNNLLLD